MYVEVLFLALYANAQTGLAHITGSMATAVLFVFD